MNKFIGIGRITHDIELRTTNNNKSVCQFTIAINDNCGDKQTTNYIDCVVWEKRAENLSKYCSKGSRIAIEGKLQTGSYEKSDGTKVKTTRVVADSIIFLGNKSNNSSEVSQVEETGPFKDFDNELELSDDDLPWID